MKVGVPDWAGIRADTLRGFIRYWPLLLAAAALDVALSISAALVVSREQFEAAGLEGYLASLILTGWDFLPLVVIWLVPTALIMNGLSETPIGRGDMLRRAGRALPVVLMVSACCTAPYLVGNLVTYSSPDYATWWLAYAAGGIGSVGVFVIVGFAGLETMARGLAPAEAFRASAALTFGRRAWLGWLYLGIELVISLTHHFGFALDTAVRARGVTLPGHHPLSDVAFALLSTVTVPLLVAVYLELRRMQVEDVPGLGAIFD